MTQRGVTKICIHLRIETIWRALAVRKCRNTYRFHMYDVRKWKLKTRAVFVLYIYTDQDLIDSIECCST